VGVPTFARLPLVDTLEDVDVAVVGVPFDTGVTFRVGGRFGPNAVRAASLLLRRYNPALDVMPFEVLSCVDRGETSWGQTVQPPSGGRMRGIDASTYAPGREYRVSRARCLGIAEGESSTHDICSICTTAVFSRAAPLSV
jgi:Arginase family